MGIEGMKDVEEEERMFSTGDRIQLLCFPISHLQENAHLLFTLAETGSITTTQLYKAIHAFHLTLGSELTL